MFWAQFPYIFTASLVKLSILLLYSKIFTTKRFQMVVRIMEGLVIIWTIAFFFASLFQAYPITLNWSPYQNAQPKGRLINEIVLNLSLACTAIFLDVMTLTLPWPMVWRLQMETRRKLAVSGIFTLGGLYVCSFVFQLDNI